MTYLVALLIFVGVYAVSKFLLLKVESLSSTAETLAIVIGVLFALFFAGALG